MKSYIIQIQSREIPKERKLQETVCWSKDKDVFIGEGLIDKVPVIFEWSEK
jgi:hypothetical protein